MYGGQVLTGTLKNLDWAISCTNNEKIAKKTTEYIPNYDELLCIYAVHVETAL